MAKKTGWLPLAFYLLRVTFAGYLNFGVYLLNLIFLLLSIFCLYLKISNYNADEKYDHA